MAGIGKSLLNSASWLHMPVPMLIKWYTTCTCTQNEKTLSYCPPVDALADERWRRCHSHSRADPEQSGCLGGQERTGDQRKFGRERCGFKSNV